MGSLSQERLDYLNNYRKKKLKRIPLDVTIEQYEVIKDAANEAGEGVNTFIKKAIDERLKKGS